MGTFLDELVQILAIRDVAVAEKKQSLFLSTQLGEIENSGSEGYLKLDKLVSDLLSVHEDEHDHKRAVALVKETYWRDGRPSHYGYLLFYLHRDADCLKISDIAWSNKSFAPTAPTE